MRIIKRKTLQDFWERNPAAEAGLRRWFLVAEAAEWTCLQDVRATFPHADPVTVRSGRTVVVFNVAGNRYRLVTAIHYNRARVFVLLVLPHKDYDRGQWKDIL